MTSSRLVEVLPLRRQRQSRLESGKEIDGTTPPQQHYRGRKTQATMKSIIAIISAILLLASSTFAFAPATPRAVVAPRSVATPTALSVFGNKKTEAQKAEEAEKAAKY